ncbi:MAG: hypothetical protein SCAL_000296 [Candidatus Syntrophoarchaeum caldarius]|uniref:Uncharacterized protein n=1 Tax=Candidatus Syntropharchaeum caldarium TaxID=1838285 RepID=A0A1F2PB44_9EURY|nr:MAG: hypothetical protein SCAL_000296 [Candidatus Syntrophoarchaeum caldarius]
MQSGGVGVVRGFLSDESGQLHTIEGLAAAGIMIATLFAVMEGAVIITPQTGLALDANLKQIGDDALAVLDAYDPFDGIILKHYVAVWNNTTNNEIIYDTITFGKGGQNALNTSLNNLLPDDILFNVDFVYVNHSNQSDITVCRVIDNGEPGTDAVVSRRLVTLFANESDYTLSPYWNSTVSVNDPQVVEVRLTLWQV